VAGVQDGVQVERWLGAKKEPATHRAPALIDLKVDAHCINLYMEGLVSIKSDSICYDNIGPV
jgi:hypothetical protein